MNKVINHVASVAIAAQPNVSGEKISHAREKAATAANAAGMCGKFAEAGKSAADLLGLSEHGRYCERRPWKAASTLSMQPD